MHRAGVSLSPAQPRNDNNGRSELDIDYGLILNHIAYIFSARHILVASFEKLDLRFSGTLTNFHYVLLT
ncbi:hypothetical protein NDU88_001355 [Pleurodeles waltl]|uniref:Uncharacterized protein n=1 Tax=Pleurodeles waltl TaxID=8319 RepID=A0AAV7VZN7_PLEWA|nr:hypothetical protein NDU88_001355 [Pleurodeles waltl]